MMMILLGILALLLAVALWILLTPIHILIDSDTHTYELKWVGIGKMALIFVQGNFDMSLKIFFWKKHFQLKGKKIVDRKSMQRVSFPKNPQRIWRILKSFRVKKFELRLDTDDINWNAFLFPIGFFFNRKNRKIIINQDGDLTLRLDIENSLFKILRAYFF